MSAGSRGQARQARGRLEARGTRVRTATRVRPRPGPYDLQLLRGRPSCRGARARPCASPSAARRATQESPWPPRHAVGRPASRGGTRAWRRAAPAFTSLGEPFSPKKRLKLNSFQEKQRTKYSSNQILLLPPGLGLHSGLYFGGLPSTSEKLSSSCSRESSDLPAPALPSRVGTCSGAPALQGTQPPRPPGRICVASG